MGKWEDSHSVIKRAWSHAWQPPRDSATSCGRAGRVVHVGDGSGSTYWNWLSSTGTPAVPTGTVRTCSAPQGSTTACKGWLDACMWAQVPCACSPAPPCRLAISANSMAAPGRASATFSKLGKQPSECTAAALSRYSIPQQTAGTFHSGWYVCAYDSLGTAIAAGSPAGAHRRERARRRT